MADEGESGGIPDALRESLAAKGYDLVGSMDADSDSDGGGFPGRILSLPPEEARERGKRAFEQGKYDKAIKCWQGGLKNILSSLCAGPEALQNQSLSELDLTLNLNIAQAYMKKGDYDAAERAVDKALHRRDALPPHQITKALYRKAGTQRAQHRLDECLETLTDLLSVDATNKAALQMQQEVDREWKRQIRAQKQNFSKLWSKMEGEDKQEREKIRRERQERRASTGILWTSDDVDSEKFEFSEAPKSDGKDWGLAFSRTVLWSIEQFAVENVFQLSPEQTHVSIWFLGASSTCELRHLQPTVLLSRLPHVKILEMVLVGFLGEYDPDNKRIPDPKDGNLPKGLLHQAVGEQHVFLKFVKGSLQDAMDNELDSKPKDEKSAPEEFSPAARNVTSEAEGAEAAAEKSAEAAADEVPKLEGPLAAPLAVGSGPLATPLTCTRTSAPPVPPDAATEPPEAQPKIDKKTLEPKATVPPTFCVIAHPHMHRYFSDFHPAISWLIERGVPTAVLGASEPDHSWSQDEMLLSKLGCDILVRKRESPYPMCLPDDPKVKKCNHIIGFCGGKALPKERLTKTKLELLSQDYTVR